MRITDNSEIEKTFVERAPLLQRNGDVDDSGDVHDNDSGNGGGDNAPTPTTPIKNPYLRPDPPAATTPVVGKTRLGSGLVKGVIGTGGMASVYLVWNERLEVHRAVKMLSLDALYDRFETEIKISAKLRHPNIVEIYNVGEWNGLSYMEMEYIDGENLQQILEARGRFPETVCCAAAIRIANALAYAHSLKFTIGENSYNGIIHRDLKPANIMFSKTGDVKLTDFGIARPAQASLHTAEGNIVGTLHYLSPEQMEGRNVDHRSDIYSLGTLIYEMATGAKTFPQETITELMRQRAANSFRKTSEYDFPISGALTKIINKCLEAKPKDRYQSIESLLDDLRKTHASLTGLPPEKVISVYYPAEDGGAALTRSVVRTEIAPKPATAGKPAEVTISMKHLMIAAPAVLLALVLLVIVAVTIAAGRGGAGGVRDIPNSNIPKSNITDSNIPKSNVPDSNIVADNGDIPNSDVTVSNNAASGNNNAVNTNYAINNNAVNTNNAVSNANYAINNNNAVNNTNNAINNNVTNSNVTNSNTTDGNIKPPAPPPRPVQTQRSAAAAKAAADPKQSEDDLIKAAAALMSRRDWVAAIRVLENADALREKRNERDLLLLEAYIETKRLDRAQPLLDDAARTNDALYFLSAGRYWYYRGNHVRALESLEASLTRSSVLRGRNVIFGDAMYYIALVRGERFKSSPTDANRAAALDGWRRVESTYSSRPDNPRLDRARREIAALN